MTNQGDRQADARSSTGTTLTYEGDSLAYFDSQGVAAGEYNGRLLAWINQALGTSYTEINGAKTALANAASIPTWDGLNLLGTVQLPPRNTRFVGVNLRHPAGLEAIGGTVNRIGRMPTAIGSGDVRRVKLSFSAAVNNNSGDQNGDTYTVLKAALELDGGGYAPVTFSGSRSISVTGGTMDVQSDWIYPSALGLSVFTRGTKLWMRWEASQADATKLFPYSWTVNQDAAAYCAFYDPATATISPVDGTGAMSKLSGAGSVFTRAEGYQPTLLGEFVSSVEPVTAAGIGDSIMWGSNATTAGVGLRGYGPFCQALYESDGVSNPIAGMCFARPGQRIVNMIGTNTKWRAYLPYATRAVEGLGTNDISVPGSGSAGTYTTLQANRIALWSAIRALGIQKICAYNYLPAASSTDGYATDTNQTPSTNWGPAGSLVEQMRDWVDARLADTTVDSVLESDALRYPAKRWLWAVAPPAPSNDYHPSTTQYGTMATELRTKLLLS